LRRLAKQPDARPQTARATGPHPLETAATIAVDLDRRAWQTTGRSVARW